ncbi:MAG TPA: MFS transporter [Rhizomicrobium sp.]|jgi:putative MFS transporter
MTTTDDTAIARFRWLPPFLRPPVPMNVGQERFILLVGVAALFAGYDLNIFGLAMPQIQASLHIPENQVALTVSYFRLATFAAILLAASADIIGRRRLLLFTIFGQAIGTAATAFVTTSAQFTEIQMVARIFSYAEEMLCYVVFAEEVAASARGWASGTLSAMDFTGTGVATLIFAGVTILPYGWRSIYIIGAIPLVIIGVLRRRLPETRRFQVRAAETQRLTSQFATTFDMLRRLAKEYPGRVIAILTAVAAFGFANAPATVLQSKYLQQTLHYTPLEVTMLLIPGGLIGLGLSIMTGRLSDRIGRKRVVFTTGCLTGIGFFFLFSGIHGWPVPFLWMMSFYGFFATDTLLAGFALEIVPTAYRATVSGLRYTVEILTGAVSLYLEGKAYDYFHAHGPAIAVMLATLPITLIAILFLPEPAGKTLEEIAPEPAAPLN